MTIENGSYASSYYNGIVKPVHIHNFQNHHHVHSLETVTLKKNCLDLLVLVLVTYC